MMIRFLRQGPQDYGPGGKVYVGVREGFFEAGVQTSTHQTTIMDHAPEFAQQDARHTLAASVDPHPSQGSEGQEENPRLLTTPSLPKATSSF